MFYLFEPIAFQLFKRLLFSEIIDDNYALCSFVVSTSNGSEAFLTRSVPYLKLNIISSNIDCSVLLDTYLNLKSTPIVARYVYWNISSVNLRKRDDFPTELFPIKTTLKR